MNAFNVSALYPLCENGVNNIRYNVGVIREEGSNSDKEMAASLIHAGFNVIDINSFDINSSEIRYQELATGEIKDNSHISYEPIDRAQYSNNMDTNIGPFKYILPATIDGLSSGTRDMSKWFNARYPYCRVGVYPGVDAQGARTVLRKRKGKGI